VPSPNFDISNMGREYHHTLLLDLLANFESINTDRLHVAIAGSLLGKKVRVFEGNYHKIRSVYEHSIKERFPNVVLCGSEELKRLLAETDKVESRGRLIRFILRFPKADVLRRMYKKYRAKQAA
jgi:exopolysaccharide biosynthesis predicted pyruvyltransferase EpsI